MHYSELCLIVFKCFNNMRGLNASSLALQWNIGLSQFRNKITKIDAFKPKAFFVSIFMILFLNGLKFYIKWAFWDFRAENPVNFCRGGISYFSASPLDLNREHTGF